MKLLLFIPHRCGKKALSNDGGWGVNVVGTSQVHHTQCYTRRMRKLCNWAFLPTRWSPSLRTTRVHRVRVAIWSGSNKHSKPANMGPLVGGKPNTVGRVESG